MPLDVHAHLAMSFDALEQVCALPVPDDEATLCIARYDVAHVRREVDAACVAGHLVALEDLLALPAKVGVRLHDLDLIVHGLEGQVLAVARQRHRRHRVHRRVGNVLEIDRNVPLLSAVEKNNRLSKSTLSNIKKRKSPILLPFPSSNTLVVGSGHYALVTVHECDRVNSAQMAIVLLHHFTTSYVVL